MGFKTAKEMVNWMMDNEGEELSDGYGRKWKYQDFKFYYKFLGIDKKYKEGIRCLHLFETPMYGRGIKE